MRIIATLLMAALLCAAAASGFSPPGDTAHAQAAVVNVVPVVDVQAASVERLKLPYTSRQNTRTVGVMTASHMKREGVPRTRNGTSGRSAGGLACRSGATAAPDEDYVLRC